MTDKQLAEKLEQVAAEANGMTAEQQAYILGTVQGIALARKMAGQENIAEQAAE